MIWNTQLLQEIANGKRQITIKFPEVDTPIKAIITDINLINPDWKPFKVNIISKGFQIKDFRWVEHDFVGEVKEEYQRPYTEDWIKVEFITDIEYGPSWDQFRSTQKTATGTL